MAFAKINHVAIVSDNYGQLAEFYKAAFGMVTSAKTRNSGAKVTPSGEGFTDRQWLMADSMSVM